MRREAFGKATKERAAAEGRGGTFPRHRGASGPKQRKPAPAPAPPPRPRRLFRPETRTRPLYVKLRPRLVSLRTRAGSRAELDIKFLCESVGPCPTYSRRGRGGGVGAARGRPIRPWGSGDRKWVGRLRFRWARKANNRLPKPGRCSSTRRCHSIRESSGRLV